MTLHRRDALLAFSFAALALTFATIEPALSFPHTWVTYVNSRFGTRVRYPASLFTPDPPPENSDGRTFDAADGAKLLIFGRFNALDESLPAIKASLAGPEYANTTYRTQGSRWFVVSGYRDVDGVPSIFYEKYILSPDRGTIHTMMLTYPAAAKATYDAIVAEMAQSFGPMN